MSTPGFYRSFSSQRWSVFFSVSVFCVVCPKEEEPSFGQNAGKGTTSLLFKLAAQTGGLVVTRAASAEANLAVSPLCENWMRLFLSSHSMSWELGSVTSENILSVPNHREGTSTGARGWPGEQPGVLWHKVTSSTVFAQPCQLSGELP